MSLAKHRKRLKSKFSWWSSLALATGLTFPIDLHAQGPNAKDLKFQLTDLGTLGGHTSKVASINNHGQIVGESTNASGDRQAFLWEGGKMTEISASRATDINDDGVVVGSIADSPDLFGGAQSTAFRWTLQTGVDARIMPRLNEGLSPKKLSGFATAINNRGDIALMGSGIATYAILQPASGGNYDIGHFGGMISIPYDVNELGEVVGMSKVNRTSIHAFLYRNQSLVDLGSLGGESVAMGVNNRTEIVGSSKDRTGRMRAFHWSEGYMKDLGTLGGQSSNARCINDASIIVGNSMTSDQTEHGFMIVGDSMVDLNDALVDSQGWVVSDAFKINDKNQIAANATKNGITHAILLSPVDPTNEPAGLQVTVNRETVDHPESPSGKAIAAPRVDSKTSKTAPSPNSASTTRSPHSTASLPKTRLQETVESTAKAPDGFSIIKTFANASPDFRRAAFTAQSSDEKQRLAVVDGKAHPAYLVVNDVIFSPDSKHYAYFLYKPGSEGAFLCRDGQLTKVDGNNKSLQFSPDSSKLIYVNSSNPVMKRSGQASWFESPGSIVTNGVAGPKFGMIGNIRVGGPGGTVAFSGVNQGEPTVVVNNQVVGVYSELPDFPFSPAPAISPDGKRTAFTAKRGRGWFLVIDQKESKDLFESVNYIRFSPDSKKVAWLAVRGKKLQAYVDGQPISEPVDSAIDVVQFSPNSKRFGVPLSKGSRQVAYIDGQATGDYDELGSVVFSHDSELCSYWGKRGSECRVYTNGVEGPAFDEISNNLQYSPDDQSIAYTAIRNGQKVLVLNGQVVDQAEEFGPFQFSPNSQSIAYWTKSENEWKISVNGTSSEHGFTEIVASQANVIDFENFKESKLLFASDTELRVVGMKSDQEIVCLTIRVDVDPAR